MRVTVREQLLYPVSFYRFQQENQALVLLITSNEAGPTHVHHLGKPRQPNADYAARSDYVSLRRLSRMEAK